MGIHYREYKGIHFTIHTDEKCGRWSWSYTLGAKFHELRERSLSSEDIAVAEAEHDTHWRIDRGAGQ